MPMLTSTGTTTSYGGRSYTVYNTGYTGIGMIISFSDGEQSCGGWFNEGDIGTNGGSWYGATCNTTSTPVGAQIQVALVKTGQPSAGTLSALNVARAAPGMRPTAPIVGSPSTLLSSYTVSFSTPNVQIVNGSCTTPDVSIPLGTFSTVGFTGVGHTTTNVGFNISVNNCPAGLNSVQYRIDPTTTVVNSSQSVVALDSSSTATGVGVQLLNNSGTALPLSSYQTFSGYSSSTGGSYTIPLKARYYQTTSTVGPGPANTSMTVTMQYL